MTGISPRLTYCLDMLPCGVLSRKDLLPMDCETIKTLARERGCRATDLIALAPPIMRSFDTTLGSSVWEAYQALMATLENQQQAVVDAYHEEMEVLQAGHAQLTPAVEQRMLAYQERPVDLWHTIERGLGAATLALEDYPLLVAHDGDDRPASLYDSACSYAGQLGASKAFQGKTAEMPRMEGTGGDLTSGDRCEIWLGGHWIAGSIEHAGKLYADASSGRAVSGYYFVADDGGICGLCMGMRVRVSV
jgi:hypothetical protein